jgi:hypothetical protein
MRRLSLYTDEAFDDYLPGQIGKHVNNIWMSMGSQVRKRYYNTYPDLNYTAEELLETIHVQIQTHFNEDD